MTAYAILKKTLNCSQQGRHFNAFNRLPQDVTVLPLEKFEPRASCWPKVYPFYSLAEPRPQWSLMFNTYDTVYPWLVNNAAAVIGNHVKVICDHEMSTSPCLNKSFTFIYSSHLRSRETSDNIGYIYVALSYEVGIGDNFNVWFFSDDPCWEVD